VAPPAAAKNPIHVGGSNTNNTTQYAHTSWGPTEDGRLKPIVTAGACQTSGDYGIRSTDNSPVDAYTTMCGTSMATPAVAGGIALMLEHYRDVYNTSGRFWPSTAKAILMQTSTDQGRPGPDYQWGYGLVDIQTAVDLISRKAFVQANVDDDEVDVYRVVVPAAGAFQVSMAWDDHEATLNADPALINDLDLEVEAPDGHVTRPWVLNPASPGSNATEGINSVDNQEQVTVDVASDDIGTWIVRVRGTTVPQGPQDYSLACEGCKVLDLGVCQSRVDGSGAMAATMVDGGPADGLPDAGLAAIVDAAADAPTEGELWQRGLEEAAARSAPRLRADISDWEGSVEAEQLALAAMLSGDPEGVPDVAERLPGTLLDEVQRVLHALGVGRVTLPETPQVSDAQELAVVEAAAAESAAVRAHALRPRTASTEGLAQRAAPVVAPSVPAVPVADRTVGGGCTYSTIAAAVSAANPGDRLLLEGGVTFNETLVVDKNLTIWGGYSGCGSGSSAFTTIDGGDTGPVVNILAGLTVSMQDLDITGGVTSLEGGGIRFALGGAGGTLNLTSVNVFGNEAQWGGGLWIGPSAQVNLVQCDIHDNVATSYGGGVRLFGGSLDAQTSVIRLNEASYGAGIYGSDEASSAPSVALTATDVEDNQALTGDGMGGGVYLREGSISLPNAGRLWSNDAILGGGAYLVTSTLTIEGSLSEVAYNVAGAHGGGLYAVGSTVNLDDDGEIEYNVAGTAGAGYGGGAYLDDSSLLSDKGSINNNTASGLGGGMYAGNGSTVDMDLGSYACLGARCSRLYNNVATTSYGGGLYANGSTVALDHTFVEGNQGTYGGAIYASNASVTMNSSLLARNNASSDLGDGIRLYTGASLSGSNNTIAYNQAAGGSDGWAISMYSSDLDLHCSVVWGHSSPSINYPDEDVTYSDVQGGYVGAGNMDVNPLFVASGSSDYHLQSTSPVIDRCVSGVSPDFDNQVRPIVRLRASSPYDMGADEVSELRVGLNSGACTFGTIQQALNAASDGDLVKVSAGTYFENLVLLDKDVEVAGGYNATCITPGAGTTRIEGSAGTGSVVAAADSAATLRDLELAWGQGTGAGILALTGSDITLDHTKVMYNHGVWGGGVYVNGGNAVTLTNDSDIVYNTATAEGGGARVWGTLAGVGTLSDISRNCALHGGGVSLNQGTLVLDESDMEGNEAAAVDGRGGGVCAVGGATIRMGGGNAWIYNSDAYDGAGVYLDGAAVEMMPGFLRGNTATNDGGGIYLANGSTLLAESGSEVGQLGYANTAQDGGGVYVSDSSVKAERVRVVGNLAVRGGGLYQAGALAVTEMGNALFHGNTATGGFGGGVRSTAGVVTLTHVTLADNLQAAGYSQSSTEGYAHNSVAWGNENGGFWVTSGTLDGVCSLDQSNNAGPALNPLFVDAGGHDYHLQAGSPARDRCGTGLSTDLDGQPRPMGLRYDVGAYEFEDDLYVFLPVVLR